MILIVFGVFVSLVVLLLMATAVAVTVAAAAAETVRGSITSIPTQTFVATTANGTLTRPRGGRIMSPSSGHTFSTGIIF